MNKQDILFKNEDGVFSYRIGGILIHEGKVLLQQCNEEKDYAIPGGHVSFGETSKDTIVREFKEETGFDVKPERLLWIGEVFFPGDTKPCHQICMYFLITLCNETEIQSASSFFVVDELERQRINLKFSWIPLADLKYIELYPLGTKEKLMNLSDNIEHFVYIENQGGDEMGDKFVVHFAELQDVTLWMNMVGIVKDEFPGLETAEQLEGYKQTVIKNINRKTAICIKTENEIIGALMFSYNLKCLSWMAVHPNYRRKGVASALITKMLELYPKDVDISVTTFRDGDIKGIAPRRLYSKFGFLQDALVEEFNYPNQIFILKR